jgi:hypothetical protein
VAPAEHDGVVISDALTYIKGVPLLRGAPLFHSLKPNPNPMDAPKVQRHNEDGNSALDVWLKTHNAQIIFRSVTTDRQLSIIGYELPNKQILFVEKKVGEASNVFLVDDWGIEIRMTMEALEKLTTA